MPSAADKNRSRAIMHLDADAFFASVEQAADPKLRGKPIAVGGEKRGIIASASYDARRMGIYTPMPTVRARKLCPKLIVVPGDFEKYERFSRWMFSYAYDFTPDVEISSIDEGYLDLTGNAGSSVEIARKIMEAIRGSLKITVSEAVGTSKLVTQIAAKMRKPAAFELVPAGEERSFLHPLANTWLPGIGPKTAVRLNAAGLARIGQIAETPVDLLHLLLGRAALQVKEFANGKDERPVVPVNAPAKSYGHQETFGADVTDEEYAHAVLRHLADRLMAQVREDGKAVRTLTVKVRYNDMAEEQRSESLQEPTDLETDVYGRIAVLLKAAWSRRVSLRMVALKFSNLYDGFARWELPLDRGARQQEARRRLSGVVDQLRRTHGESAILRGHDFKLQQGPLASEAEATRKPVIRIRSRKTAAVCYTPLRMRSYYTFLDSALSVERIVQLAAEHELPAVALADKGNLHGAVEFIQSAGRAGINPIVGAEIEIEGRPLCLYVENEQGYRNLCRILTRYNEWLATGQGSEPHEEQEQRALVAAQRGKSVRQLAFGFSDELAGNFGGLIAVSSNARFAPYFPGRFYLGVTSGEAARKAPRGLKCVASLPVHYESVEDRLNFDVLQSIRTRTLLRQMHPEKKLGGQFHFRPPAEMATLFGDAPELLEHSRELADRCAFQFPFGKPQFPAFSPPDGSSPAQFLDRLVHAGLEKRYGARAAQYRRQVEEELAIINEVNYAEYFLAVWDILQDCRKLGIDWITRGSAADSLVCYCLGISDVCPIRFDLYFRRFLNNDRMALDKLPDIDLDFAHDVKDRVIDLIFEKYGSKQVAVVGGFSTYKARGAVGDIAKVLGVSEYQIRRFTERIPYSHATNLEAVLEHTRECSDLPLKEEPYATTVKLAAFLDGFPRYPKMHPCGVVVSRGPMLDLTPCFTSNKGYATTHFDMEAIEAIGLIKMDILAQGGLAVMRDVQKMLLPSEAGPEENTSSRVIPKDSKLRAVADLHRLEPWDDPEVWELIAGGGARAVHHIESPAMVGLCRMCNVREIDGLIAIVSVIRPGAANEHKKISFTRRYQGFEPIVYPHPSLEACTRSTFGMVVYEEHILQICEAFAGLPPGRADVLRRALGKEKHAVIEEIKAEFFECARRLKRTAEDTQKVWDLVTSFRGYAFCKAHSTAYGVEAYQSAWLKRYYPTEFMAAVLSNGKGFYAPLVYVLECHRLGISMLSPSVNDPGPAFTVVESTASPAAAPATREWRITPGQTLELNESLRRLPPGGTSAPRGAKAIRVPATRVKGLTERTCDRMVEERRRAPFVSMQDFHQRVHPLPEEMEALIKVGAFDHFGKTRTAQFWEMQMLVQAEQTDREQGWLFPPPRLDRLPPVPLQEPSRLERLRWEQELLDFPVAGHPLDLYPDIAWETYCPVAELGRHCGETVVTCGLIIEERMFEQITGEPMKFITIADYTGIIETELFAETYKTYGLATVRYPVLEVTATVEPFENGRGHTLRVLKASRPRTR